MRVEKSVFISYRRTNAMTARAVYQHLNKDGYDVFLDYETIDSGDFSQIIINQVKSRAHFIIILTPSALERCVNPDDWLRREIECAIDHKRNIIPLMFEGFDFINMEQYLTGKLEILSSYNSLRIPADFFEEAMTRLENRFLNVALDTVLHPVPSTDKMEVQDKIARANELPQVTENQLTADEYFELAVRYFNEDEDYESAIKYFTKGIRLNPNLFPAFYNRGLAHYYLGEYDSAIDDYTESIRLEPNHTDSYIQRGLIYSQFMNDSAAIADFTKAIAIYPDASAAYSYRALAYFNKRDFDKAISDFTNVLRIHPKSANAYQGRGSSYLKKGDYQRAISDLEAALRLDPGYPLAQSDLKDARELKARSKGRSGGLFG